MLTCNLDNPNEKIAEYVGSFLHDPVWVRRRIETVTFLDYDTIRSRTTLDIQMSTIANLMSDLPLHPSRPLVPLAVLKKDLLANFDLRDASGNALSVVPRYVDTFFAFSFLCAEAAKVLGNELGNVAVEIRQHLKNLVFDFPDIKDKVSFLTVNKWNSHESWESDVLEKWEELLENNDFNGYLRDFTFNYILIAQLPSGPDVQIVKYSHQSSPRPNLRLSKNTVSELIGFDAAEFSIQAPSIGWDRSYHFQVKPPEGVVVTDLYLVRGRRISEVRRSDNSNDIYNVQMGNDFAQAYATDNLMQASFNFIVLLRVSIVGYLRAAWLSTIFAAAVLLFGDLFLPELRAAVGSRAEAAVALLLVAPSLIAAYLVRPGEHVLASSLLRFLRYLAGLSGLLTYIAAAVLVLKFRGETIPTTWNIVTGIAILDTLIFTIAMARTQNDVRELVRMTGRTYQFRVIDVPLIEE